MKKLIVPVSTGGLILSDDILETVFNQEIWTALESILQSVAPSSSSGNVGVIVSGCQVTGSGPYNCSSGIVYMNGQFMALSGFTGLTLPQYIVPATLTVISKTFANGVPTPTINQQDASVTASLPGSGQYITLSTTGYYGGLGGQRLDQFFGRDQNYIATAVAISNVTNQSAVNPTSLTFGNIYYRRSNKETFVEIVVAVGFAAIPTVININNIPAILDALFQLDPLFSTAVGYLGNSYSGTTYTPVSWKRNGSNSVQATPYSAWSNNLVTLNLSATIQA